MTDETYEEISTFLDMVEGRLTFKGFFQLYQLQTGSYLPSLELHGNIPDRLLRTLLSQSLTSLDLLLLDATLIFLLTP